MRFFISFFFFFALIAGPGFSQKGNSQAGKGNRVTKTSAVKQNNGFPDQPTRSEPGTPARSPQIGGRNVNQQPAAATAATGRGSNTGLLPQELIQQLDRQSQPFIQEKTNGSINWTEQYIEAKGEAVIDNEKFTNPSQARLMARRGAVVVAQRNLLEIIKGVQVIGETTVQDMMTTRDYIYSRVEGTVKGARMVGEPIEKDGIIEVRLRVPLYEAQGSLASILYPEIGTLQGRAAGAGMMESPNVQEGGGQPKSKRAEAGAPEGADPQAAVQDGKARPEDYNPFVFNIRNPQAFNPSMFPVITDESGNIVLDFSKIYDPQKGRFPQLLNLAKDATQTFGWKQGEQVVDLVASGGGKLQLAPGQKGKINWTKVFNTVRDIGRFIIRLL
ncbi:MAG: hypothetical protein N2050_06635 [Flavobacteriales bacterium]|nr:hypothetical protein [Flavobacteriales bacterium]